MKVIYNTLSLIAIILLNSCAQGDKKVDATPTTDGPNVIIDSGNIGGGGPLDAGNSNQSLVIPQQEKTALVSSQNIQMTPAQMQQIQQQAIQNQQIQQPQQAVVSQTAAHPQFSDVEFKKMQDDAQKRGVQLNPVHGQPGHRCDIYVGQPIDAKPVPALTKGAATTTAPKPSGKNNPPLFASKTIFSFLVPQFIQSRHILKKSVQYCIAVFIIYLLRILLLIHFYFHMRLYIPLGSHTKQIYTKI